MTSEEEKVLRLVTWNTRGIKKTNKLPDKLSDVLKKLSDINTDIAFIQETHVGLKDSRILEDVEKEGCWKVFFTVHSPRSKGVAILIRDTVPFEYICHDEDYTGGYIVLFCRLYHEHYTLVNVYNHKKDKKVLGRLKDYLLDMAQGVLVVGGDFNTILHPTFDRKSDGDKMNHSPFRGILEDFITSLYLRDTWTYFHPTDEGFTRYQNDIHARIDMFFLAENTVGRARGSHTETIPIFDHVPLVLDLRVQQQNVAPVLEEFYDTPDRGLGKINGAEILRAIKSLTDSEEREPGKSDIAFYKNNRCPLSEILKKKFNNIIKTKEVPDEFELPKVEYLIFKRILASRLNEFLTPSFTGRMDANLDILLTVRFVNDSQKISWPFLENILSRLDWVVHNPPRDFSILGQVLPESSQRDLRLLQNDCPLTKHILSLALKHLDSTIREDRRCTTTVCYQRQALCIHTHPNTHEVRMTAVKFEEKSGLSLETL